MLTLDYRVVTDNMHWAPRAPFAHPQTLEEAQVRCSKGAFHAARIHNPAEILDTITSRHPVHPRNHYSADARASLPANPPSVENDVAKILRDCGVRALGPSASQNRTDYPSNPRQHLMAATRVTSIACPLRSLAAYDASWCARVISLCG
ncbi:hypothetical protein PHYPSEUDO_002863 [Phytophthora pseudosyringae]|uniref:Uncharacterized protein n=1 Tax=Phytophthora pseudosyringae TaxID=221518 RepID=A0A8T1V557_9STRA|nr:hypothetical protein PHYPSEUDO_002863 [Phytophthora pseudosyringae]